MSSAKVAPDATRDSDSDTITAKQVTDSGDKKSDASKMSDESVADESVAAKDKSTTNTNDARVSPGHTDSRDRWVFTLCDLCGSGAPDAGLPFTPACKRMWCLCCHYGRLQAYAFQGNCLFWCCSIALGFGYVLIGWRRNKLRNRFVLTLSPTMLLFFR